MKSLFILFLKVLGVYVFITIVFSLPELLSSVFLAINDADFTYFSFFLFILIIRLVVSWILSMRSSVIADYLIKEEESNEKVSVTIPAVITIAVIMAGFWIIINELPNLVHQLTNKFFRPQFNYESFFLLASLVKLGIGVWMIFWHKWIANQINKKA